MHPEDLRNIWWFRSLICNNFSFACFHYGVCLLRLSGEKWIDPFPSAIVRDLIIVVHWWRGKLVPPHARHLRMLHCSAEIRDVWLNMGVRGHSLVANVGPPTDPWLHDMEPPWFGWEHRSLLIISFDRRKRLRNVSTAVRLTNRRIYEKIVDQTSRHPQTAVCALRWARQVEWKHSVFGAAWNFGWKEHREDESSRRWMFLVSQLGALIGPQIFDHPSLPVLASCTDDGMIRAREVLKPYQALGPESVYLMVSCEPWPSIIWNLNELFGRLLAMAKLLDERETAVDYLFISGAAWDSPVKFSPVGLTNVAISVPIRFSDHLLFISLLRFEQHEVWPNKHCISNLLLFREHRASLNHE